MNPVPNVAIVTFLATVLFLTYICTYTYMFTIHTRARIVSLLMATFEGNTRIVVVSDQFTR